MGCDVWLLVQYVLVNANVTDPVEGIEAWEFGLRVPVQTISLRGGRVWCWKGREAVCRLAIQGRVSQNLRLIQVIFGHTSSEGKKVCLPACVRMCVCVQNKVQAEDDGEFHLKVRLAVYTPRQKPKVSTTRSWSGGVVFCCLRKKIRRIALPRGRDFVATAGGRNLGRSKAPVREK